MTKKGEILKALRLLRSGNAHDINEGERILMRMSGVGPTSACGCPNFPSERGRDCFAHYYIPISVAESQAADGGTSMRDIIAMIRRRTGAAT